MHDSLSTLQGFKKDLWDSSLGSKWNKRVVLPYSNQQHTTQDSKWKTTVPRDRTRTDDLSSRSSMRKPLRQRDTDQRWTQVLHSPSGVNNLRDFVFSAWTEKARNGSGKCRTNKSSILHKGSYSAYLKKSLSSSEDRWYGINVAKHACFLDAWRPATHIGNKSWHLFTGRTLGWWCHARWWHDHF